MSPVVPKMVAVPSQRAFLSRPTVLPRAQAARDGAAQAGPSHASSPAAPLKGRDWATGLADWMHRHASTSMHDCRTRFESAEEPFSDWMFRHVFQDGVAHGVHTLEAPPAYVMAAVLAPLAGLDPSRDEETLRACVTGATLRPETPMLSRSLVMRLLVNLFGRPDSMDAKNVWPLPNTGPDIRFWAALGDRGQLWVSDARWGQAGGFLVEYPESLTRADMLIGTPTTHRIQWDANWAQYRAQTAPPVLMVWRHLAHAAAATGALEPPRHVAHGFIDLLTDEAFEAANRAPAPVEQRWAARVEAQWLDARGRPLCRFVQEKSELLSFSESWLAGLRFETLAQETPNEAMDAAALLSFVSLSLHQCPIEQKMVEVLRRLEATKMQWAALRSVEGGDWVQGVLEDLLIADCRSAYWRMHGEFVSGAPVPPGGARCGTVEVWLSDPKPLADAQTVPVRYLNFRAEGALFGATPVTLRREIHDGAAWFPQNVQVTFGQKAPNLRGAAGCGLVFSLVGREPAQASRQVAQRARAQQAFWNALLDFNDARGG